MPQYVWKDLNYKSALFKIRELFPGKLIKKCYKKFYVRFIALWNKILINKQKIVGNKM